MGLSAVPYFFALALGALPLSATACGAESVGCSALMTAAAPVCQAKLSCAGLEGEIERAKHLFAACANRQEVTQAEVAALLADFGSELEFQCCVGNAQYLEIQD